MTSPNTPTTPTTRLGLSTCRDLYGKLKFDASQLDAAEGEGAEKELMQEYAAFNFFVTAWHLYHDWLDKDLDGRPAYALQKKEISADAFREVKDAIRGLANGSKHLTSWEEPKISVSEREIVDFRSYFFGPAFGIRTESHYFSLMTLEDIVLRYFEWIFDDSVLALGLPEHIVSRMAFCKVDRLPMPPAKKPPKKPKKP